MTPSSSSTTPFCLHYVCISIWKTPLKYRISVSFILFFFTYFLLHLSINCFKLIQKARDSVFLTSCRIGHLRLCCLASESLYNIILKDILFHSTKIQSINITLFITWTKFSCYNPLMVGLGTLSMSYDFLLCNKIGVEPLSPSPGILRINKMMVKLWNANLRQLPGAWSLLQPDTWLKVCALISISLFSNKENRVWQSLRKCILV